jgi:hypothetical protein
MRIDNPPAEKLAASFAVLTRRASRGKEPVFVKYLDLGTRMVRLLNYAPEFTPHIEKQLTYVLRDYEDHHDVSLVVWREGDMDTLAAELCPPEPPGLRQRVEALAAKKRGAPAPSPPDRFLQVFESSYARHHPLINVDPWARIVSAYDPAENTYYYAAENLGPEEFIKQGHLFVQTLNKILKTPSGALVHGAAVGLNGRGILLCARGQRGKSTLAVRAMLDGFDYVSDDYLVLGKEGEGLYAWPIYSIITLAPMMYGDLYSGLEAKFVSNNARKDKYVFNIAAYHHRFRGRYPMVMGMIPQIVPDPEPEIVACTRAGKGRAVTQLIHSTIAQMGDKHDIASVKKITDFVGDLPFYQINLCRDIEKNLACLRAFLESGVCGRQVNTPGMFSSRAANHGIFGRQ